MKSFIKILILLAVLMVVMTAGVALASGLKSPAEVLAGLSGQPMDELQIKRREGRTYGSIAEDYGKLEEFREQVLEQKEAILDKRVEEGYITPEKAEEIRERMGAFCDGEGSPGICNHGYGAGFGMGTRHGVGQKKGLGHGRGRGCADTDRPKA